MIDKYERIMIWDYYDSARCQVITLTTQAEPRASFIPHFYNLIPWLNTCYRIETLALLHEFASSLSRQCSHILVLLGRHFR